MKLDRRYFRPRPENRHLHPDFTPHNRGLNHERRILRRIYGWVCYYFSGLMSGSLARAGLDNIVRWTIGVGRKKEGPVAKFRSKDAQFPIYLVPVINMENLFASRAARLLRAAFSRDARPSRAFRIPIEPLEGRLLLSVNITSYDNANIAAGVNSQETALTPSNVNINSFGKQYSVAVDGQVYAQPLVETGVTISAGVNTTAGAAGLHNVVFVATENDSIYAFDTTTGAVLWMRTFLSTTGGTTAGTDIDNPQATSITTVPATDDQSPPTDISPVVGITGTPVIDSANSRLYVVVSTKETIGGVINWVQRLHAINLSNGTDVVVPYLIAATPTTGADDTNIYVYGTGDGGGDRSVQRYGQAGCPVRRPYAKRAGGAQPC